MLLRGELRQEPATSGEVERLLTTIIRRLEDAGNEANHPETRLEQAYHAILNCALAGFRANGLRKENALVLLITLCYTDLAMESLPVYLLSGDYSAQIFRGHGKGRRRSNRIFAFNGPGGSKNGTRLPGKKRSP
ncbi:hypothetical protein ACFLS5_00685 [Candidatus Bipolaricaulota bacterium]